MELKQLRTLTAKHHDNGDGTKTLEAHVGHIHYEDKLGGTGLRGIDFTLFFDDVKRGWYFNYHSFRPFLPEYADEWVEFRDLFEDKDQTTRYKAVCSHVLGRLVMPEDIGLADTAVNCVIYDNAFGEGIDYILYFTRSALKKVVRIREKSSEDMTFDFEVDFPLKEVKRGRTREDVKYSLDKTRDKQFDTDKHTLIGDDQHDGKEWHTYLRPFKCWDSGGINQKEETIIVDYFLSNGKSYLKKTVTAEFLQSSIGDVFTDTTTTYYPSSGDGQVINSGANFSTVRNAASGSSTRDTATAYYCETGLNASTYEIYPAWFMFDTSGIPSGDTISSATFSVDRNGDNQNNPSLCLTQGSQATWNVLTTGDFDQRGLGGGEGASRVSAGTGSTTGYLDFSMNSTGIGWIAKSGETKPASASATGKTQLCIVFAKDYDNQQPGTFDYTQLRFSEYSGTANDPKLVVTYSSSLTSTIVDTINLTENTSRLLSMISSKVETITLSESFSAMRAFVSSVTETINLSEFTSRIQSFVSLNIDTISLSESFTTIKSLLSTVVDTVNLSELNQSFKAHVSHVLDSITMVDLVGSARTVIQKTKILSATIIKPTMVGISTIKAKIKGLDKQ